MQIGPSRRAMRRMITPHRPSAEPLERRTLFDNQTFTWLGGNGDWSDPTQWDIGQVPNGTNDAVVINAGTVTVDHTVAADQISVAAAATVDVNNGGDLTASGGTIAGTVNVDGGTLSGADTITNPGLLVLSGTSNVVGGTLGDDGYIDSIGTLNLANVTFDNVEVESSGVVNLSGALTGQTGYPISGLDALGPINITGDASLTGLDVVNHGTLTKTGGAGTATFGQSTTFEDDGTVAVDSGSISVQQQLDLQSATFQLAAGTSFVDALPIGTDAQFSGTISGSGAGHLVFQSGAAELAPSDGSTGTGADLYFPAGFAQVTGTEFDGTLNDQITNSGELDYVGDVDHAACSLNNYGTIVVTGAGNFAVGNGQTFNNGGVGTAAVVDFESDAGVIATGASGTIFNAGKILKSGGFGTTVFGANGTDVTTVNDDGTVAVETGTLCLGGGVTGVGDVDLNGGGYSIASGSVLELSTGSGTTNIAGTIGSGGGGHVILASGTLAGPATTQDATGPGVLDYLPGTFLDEGGVIDGAADLINEGEIDLVGTNTVEGIDNNGTIMADAGPLSLGGLINNPAGVVDFTADQAVSANGSGKFSNQGLLVKSAGTGTLDLSGLDVVNTGTIEAAAGTLELPDAEVSAGSTVEVDAGATVTMPADAPVASEIDGVVTLAGAGASFPGLAAATAIGSGGSLTILSGASFTTAGDLSVAGTLVVGGSVTVTGNLVVASPATTSTPTLAFAVAGAPGTTAAPTLAVYGTTTFAGDLTAAEAAGFATTAGEAYTVATFATAATGAFASVAGVGPTFTATVTPTEIVLATANTITSTPTPTPTPSPTPTPAPAPTPTGTLTTANVKSTVPARVIAATKSDGVVQVSVTNAGAAKTTGSDTVKVYATATGVIDGASVLVGSVTNRLNLNPTKAKRVAVPVQTSRLAAGTYTLLAATVDAGGTVTYATAGTPLLVVAPVVELSATVGATTPGPPVAGRPATVLVDVGNTGTVDATGKLTFTVGLSIDGTTVAQVLTTVTRLAHMKAGAAKLTPFHLRFTIPSLAANGGTRHLIVAVLPAAITGVMSTGATATGPAFTAVVKG